MVLALLLTLTTKLQQSNETIKEMTTLWQRPLVATDAIGFYLAKLAVPLVLTPDYGRIPSVVCAWGLANGALLLPVAAVVALVWLRSRVAWAAAAVFLAGLLPVLGLVPFGFQDISTVADRYIYLAMLGPAMLCVAVHALAEQGALGRIGGGVGLVERHRLAAGRLVARQHDAVRLRLVAQPAEFADDAQQDHAAA